MHAQSDASSVDVAQDAGTAAGPLVPLTPEEPPEEPEEPEDPDELPPDAPPDELPLDDPPGEPLTEETLGEVVEPAHAAIEAHTHATAPARTCSITELGIS
jgi:hypothetical protein